MVFMYLLYINSKTTQSNNWIDIATDYLMHIFAWLLVLVSTNIRQERLHL